MGINRNGTIDLTTKQFQAFLLDAQQAIFNAPKSVPDDLTTTATDEQPIGSLDEIDKKPIGVPWITREHYLVIRGRDDAKGNQGVVIGEFDVDVPTVQNIRISTLGQLLVKRGLNAGIQAEIETAFSAFNAQMHGDPEDYMSEVLRSKPDIKASMFLVLPIVSVEKVGQPEERDEDRRAKLALYKGDAVGTIYGRKGEQYDIHGDGTGYIKHDLLLTCELASKAVLEKPEPLPRHRYQIDVPPDKATNNLDAILSMDAAKMRCSPERYKFIYFRIMELMRIPEFKVEWITVRVEIGCVIFDVAYPKLFIRWSNLVLFAFFRRPDDLIGIVEDAIVSCLYESVMLGAVVGVVMGNFASALAVFQSHMTRCLERKFEDFLSCMLPGIALNNEVTEDWH